MSHIIFGIEESPYSVKVRSYFRYKNLPHEWINRNQNPELYGRHARLPLIPLVVTPEDTAVQDSTPIIQTFESKYPDPSIHPDDDVARFVSCILEEFGDEWGNKWMFHFRWARDVDQIACAKRLAGWSNPDASPEQLDAMAEQIRNRMVDRVWFVGSNASTAPIIEESFKEAVAILDNHLIGRNYLFGERPSFGDFGLWGQIYNANRDVTPAEILKPYTNVVAWLERMLSPTNLGPFESWSELSNTLTPLLKTQVSELFLPWSEANSEAILASQDEFDVELRLGKWVQKPQKYHAKSLSMLRQEYTKVQTNKNINELLAEVGCLSYFQNH